MDANEVANVPLFYQSAISMTPSDVLTNEVCAVVAHCEAYYWPMVIIVTKLTVFLTVVRRRWWLGEGGSVAIVHDEKLD